MNIYKQTKNSSEPLNLVIGLFSISSTISRDAIDTYVVFVSLYHFQAFDTTTLRPLPSIWGDINIAV